MLAQGSDVGTAPRKVALVVVHGVGETDPGYCVGHLFENLHKNAPGYEVDNYSLSERLPDPQPVIKEVEQGPRDFPVNLRKASHQSGIELLGLELYWADTTILQPGRLNTIIGLARTIFKSQHLVRAMLDRRGHFASAIVRHLLLFAAWLLRGPIAAVTIVTAAVCAVFMFEPEWVHYHIPGMRLRFVAAMVALLLLSIFFLNRMKKQNDYIWYDAVVFTGFLSVVLLVLDQFGWLFDILEGVRRFYNYNIVLEVLSRFYGHDVLYPDPGKPFNCTLETEFPACYVSGLYRAIISLWRIWGALILLAVLVYFVVWLVTRKSERGTAVAAISTSVSILVLQFLLWVTVVVSLLYPMLIRAETRHTLGGQVVSLAATVSGHFAEKPPSAPEISQFVEKMAGDDAAASQHRFSELLGLSDIQPDWIERFKFIYLCAAITLVTLLGAVAWLMVGRKSIAARGLRDLKPGEEPPQELLEANAAAMPRLLHSSLISIMVWSFCIVFFFVYFQHIFSGPLATARNVVLPLTAVLAVAVSYLIGPRITNVVHVARDLIDHHFRPKSESTPQLRPGLKFSDNDFVRRIRIRRRLQAILDKYLRNGGYDCVIFVAHSQGSVIAYDYLRNAAPDYPELGHARPSLLSCGSPIGTLYQEYFSEYGRDAVITEDLRRTLRQWINMYRLDDYIGGLVSGPPEFPIENIVMKSGMHRHTEYWSEPRLAQVLNMMINPPPSPPQLTIRETRDAPRSMPMLWPPAPRAMQGA